MNNHSNDDIIKNKKKEEKCEEFNGVVDASCLFLKKIFPHTYSLIEKLRSSKKSKINN